MKVSIPKAARLTGKSKQTLYRHIARGKLSTNSGNGNKTVNTSELVRVYGELRDIGPSSEMESAKPRTKPDEKTESHSAENDLLKDQIKHLKTQLATAEKREKQLLALLESPLLQSAPTQAAKPKPAAAVEPKKKKGKKK
ncbi:MAG: hypothetical protein GY862_22625, partial [Gammaproteobacteria bacterium]|nr:hypothetical protein [Gammaproteobacteria bacterium]